MCGTEQKATQFALAAAAREKTTREQRKPSVQMPHSHKGIYLCVYMFVCVCVSVENSQENNNKCGHGSGSVLCAHIGAVV